MKNRRMKVLLLAAGIAFAISGIALAEDAYIQASGAQAINTGYFVNSNTKIAVDFQMPSADTAKTVFGGIDGAGSSCCLWVNGGGSLEPRFGGGWCGGMVKGDAARYTAVFDMPEKTVKLYSHGGSTPIATKTSANNIADNGKSDRPLVLFAMGKSSNGFTSTDYSSCKIYSFKILEKGKDGEYALVRNLVPCIKGGIPGFRDMVTGVFLMSESSTGILAGGDIECIPDDGYIQLVGNNGGNNGQKSGGHYIETSYTPGPNTRIELDYAFAPTNKVGDWVALSSGADAGPLFELRSQSSQLKVSLGTYLRQDTGLPAASAANSVRRTIILDAPNSAVTLLTAGFQTFAMTNATALVTGNMSSTLRIGSWANGSWHCAPIKIYGLKIYESNVLKYDYIPTVQEGRAGLLSGSTFKVPSFNTSADIVHVGGVECGGSIAVESEIERDAYVESFGAQALNSGYFPGSATKIEIDYQVMPVNKATLEIAKSTTLFGTVDGSGTTCCLWINGNGNLEPNFGGWCSGIESPATTWRRTMVYDMQSKSVKQYALGKDTPRAEKDSTKVTDKGGSNRPIGLFAMCKSTDGSTFANYGRCRIYHMTIWDGESRKRDYVPCVIKGTPCLYDRENGTVLSSPGLVVAGRGRGGAEEWVVLPQGGTLTKSEGSKVLSAVAVGAQSYKWTKNGAAVAGGTDGNLTVTWAKGGKTDIYTVIPVYSIFGEDCHGSPVSVAVYNAPLGMVIILK